MAGIHKPNLWLKSFELMIEGYTLPKIVERLKMHISTAFYWRHKNKYLTFLFHFFLGYFLKAFEVRPQWL
jgi:hypothetical protein